MIGNTLSHYKIISKLGQGGMGEVYLAEDSRLNRKVALKILPQHLSDRAELRERFEREARAVSSLNHPHICTLYDIGEQDGIHYLVMEHLVGETLEARLAKGPLPLEQTLEYAIQIADALDKAHRQGVVHRDLKPGNIMLVKSGAKLLDFGLAKLQAAETPTNLSALPTEQANLTAEGTILGTLQYMAPEQLEAKEADSRTDIFAFGAVVYEMATGKKAFEGSSQASLIAAIMGQDPPAMSELQPMTPSFLDRVVKRCLAKEPDERWQSASDLMTGLRWVTEVGTSADSLPAVTAPVAWKRAIPWSIVVVMALVAGVAIWSLTRPKPLLVKRLVVTTAPAASFLDTVRTDLTISPDGRYIVYVAKSNGTTQLYSRALDEFIAKPIPGTEGATREPFFSPDGRSVAFVAGGKLKRISLAGGPAITLCDAPAFEGGSWDSEDKIVFADLNGADTLYRIPAAGGEPQMLATPDPGEGGYQQPQILPGGKAVLFAVSQQGGTSFQIAVLSLDTGEQKTVIENGRQPHYLPTGHLVYELTHTGTLMAVPFDMERLELSGDPVPVFEGVRSASGEGTADYSIANDGTLVYVPSTPGLIRTLAWVNREGQEEPLASEPQGYVGPRISPDGSRLAITIEESGGSDVWIYDLEREIQTRLTFDPAEDHYPVWTPDGQRIVFDSGRAGANHKLFWKAADGTGQAERLTTGPNQQTANSFSPDGKRLVFLERNSGLQVLSMEGERTSQPLFQSPFNELNGMISPDGHWFAYESNESGRLEVYVRPFPNVEEGKWQISGDGGTEPVWAPRGQELFYRNGGAMMAVGIKTEPTFTAGSPVVLFTGRYTIEGPVVNYDISPDGQRFLMMKEADEEEEPAQIHVVLNWFEEVKRLAPTN